MVSMLRARCVMICCCAPVGMAVHVACGPQWGWTCNGAANRFLRWGALTSIGVKGLITLVARSVPSVLLHVTCQCSLGVDFSMRFAIGFRVSIAGGALVSQDTVIMGELLITLCCALHSSC
jgi:hypothetical protein